MSEDRTKQLISDWWARRPMTYGTVHGETTYWTGTGSTETLKLGTYDFFERLDRTFYSWNPPLHTEAGFFAKIFPYEQYNGRNVLEIGCGLGTMAMNWARHGARITAVDLNPVAVAQTAQRFKLFGLRGLIVQADAHVLSFGDEIFDYVYSWGVLHHSPNLAHALTELLRVLRPGGRFGVMLYNRDSIFYRYTIAYVEGFLHAESRFLGPLQLASRYTDGSGAEGNPHTWPVTRREIREMLSPYTADLTIKVLGQELDSLFELLLPKVGAYIPRPMKKALARRWGWSLWITGTKL